MTIHTQTTIRTGLDAAVWAAFAAIGLYYGAQNTGPALATMALLVIGGMCIPLAGQGLRETYELLFSPVIEDTGRPVVTLCGSTRYMAEITAAAAELTSAGYMVLRPEVISTAGTAISPRAKDDLDDLHRDKIRVSDYVLVIAPAGYIGESTTSEIRYAADLRKPVRYVDPAAGDAVLPTSDAYWATVRPITPRPATA